MFQVLFCIAIPNLCARMYIVQLCFFFCIKPKIWFSVCMCVSHSIKIQLTFCLKCFACLRCPYILPFKFFLFFSCNSCFVTWVFLGGFFHVVFFFLKYFHFLFHVVCHFTVTYIPKRTRCACIAFQLSQCTSVSVYVCVLWLSCMSKVQGLNVIAMSKKWKNRVKLNSTSLCSLCCWH